MLSDVKFRTLLKDDLEHIVRTFTFPWSTFEATLKQWQIYLDEHLKGIRTVIVLERQGEYLGYGSFLRSSDNPLFRDNGIPEVNALWIDEPYREKGLGTQLIKHIEEIARKEGCKMIGIGVGLYKDYGPAQKLYNKLGYFFDGNGATYKSVQVVPGESYPIDDELIIWLTKPLSNS